MSYTGNINIGAMADDKTGTPLRTLCDNTNINYNQLFNLATDGSTPLNQQNFVLATGTGIDAEAALTDMPTNFLPAVTVITSNNNLFTLNQLINGSSNTTQLTVKGHSTQTDPIFRVDNNSLSERFSISGAGVVNVLGTLTSGLINGRNIATDGTKLDTIETGADVTDSVNVKSSIEGASLTLETVPNALDKMFIVDVGASNLLRNASFQNTLFTSLTIPSPINYVFETGDSLLIYDQSTSGLKRPSDPSRLAPHILNNASITSVTPATNDLIFIHDVSDSNNAKSISVSDMVALYNFNSNPYIISGTASYNASAEERFIEINNGGQDVLLPAASGNAGKMFNINNITSSVCRVIANGGDLINGSSSIRLGRGATLELICTGSGWRIVGSDKVLIYNSGLAAGTASVTINNISTATFRSYEIRYNLSVNTTTSRIKLQVSSDNGSTFVTSNYHRCILNASTTTGSPTGATPADSLIEGLGSSNSVDAGFKGTIYLSNMGTYPTALSRASTSVTSADPRLEFECGRLRTSGSYNAFRIIPNAGTFSVSSQDIITVWGIL